MIPYDQEVSISRKVVAITNTPKNQLHVKETSQIMKILISTVSAMGIGWCSLSI